MFVFAVRQRIEAPRPENNVPSAAAAPRVVTFLAYKLAALQASQMPNGRDLYPIVQNRIWMMAVLRCFMEESCITEANDIVVDVLFSHMCLQLSDT